MSEYQLPQRVHELVELIGTEATLTLMAKYGGLVLDIPRNADRAERLKDLLPSESVQKLCEYWGGDRFYVPKMDAPMRQWRDAVIHQLRPTHSINRLARHFKLSDRRVKAIVAQPAPEVQLQPPKESQLALHLD